MRKTSTTRNSRDKLKKKRGPRKGPFKKKECKFCVEKIPMVDYKDVSRLQKFITERGKIVSSRISGNCAKHQRKVAKAVKRARMAAFLPFVAE
ncbi:MAG: 30S ribosomal protein S18 [Candidatus Omnitrophota bacterium]